VAASPLTERQRGEARRVSYKAQLKESLASHGLTLAEAKRREVIEREQLQARPLTPHGVCHLCGWVATDGMADDDRGAAHAEHHTKYLKRQDADNLAVARYQTRYREQSALRHASRLRMARLVRVRPRSRSLRRNRPALRRASALGRRGPPSRRDDPERSAGYGAPCAVRTGAWFCPVGDRSSAVGAPRGCRPGGGGRVRRRPFRESFLVVLC
jgi:hypothetical protein